jgi:hypothetical protein
MERIYFSSWKNSSTENITNMKPSVFLEEMYE